MKIEEVFQCLKDILKEYFNLEIEDSDEVNSLRFDKDNGDLIVYLKYKSYFKHLTIKISNFNIGEKVYFMFENKIKTGLISEIILRSQNTIFTVEFNEDKSKTVQFYSYEIFKTKEELIKSLM